MHRILTAGTATLASLLLAAHALRWGWLPLVVLCLALPLLLVPRQPWSRAVLGAALALGTVEWLRATAALANQRITTGEPWVRATLILGVVTLFTGASALALKPWHLVDPDHAARAGARGSDSPENPP